MIAISFASKKTSDSSTTNKLGLSPDNYLDPSKISDKTEKYQSIRNLQKYFIVQIQHYPKNGEDIITTFSVAFKFIQDQGKRQFTASDSGQFPKEYLRRQFVSFTKGSKATKVMEELFIRIVIDNFTDMSVICQKSAISSKSGFDIAVKNLIYWFKYVVNTPECITTKDAGKMFNPQPVVTLPSSNINQLEQQVKPIHDQKNDQDQDIKEIEKPKISKTEEYLALFKSRYGGIFKYNHLVNMLISHEYIILIVGGIGKSNDKYNSQIFSSFAKYKLPKYPLITTLNIDDNDGADYTADITCKNDIDLLVDNNIIDRKDVIIFECLPHVVYNEQTMKNLIKLMHADSILIVLGFSLERASELNESSPNDLFTMIMKTQDQRISIYKITT